MVKTGIATQRVSPRDTAMMSDDIDISETSNSAKRSCRQNISDGCTMVGTSLIPCGTTRPSRSGRVRSLSESAMLSSRREAVILESIDAESWLIRPHPEEHRSPLLRCVSKEGAATDLGLGAASCFETCRSEALRHSSA